MASSKKGSSGKKDNSVNASEENLTAIDQLTHLAMPENYQEIQKMIDDAIKASEADINKKLQETYALIDKANARFSKAGTDYGISDDADTASKPAEEEAGTPENETHDATASSVANLTDLMTKAGQDVSATMQNAESQAIDALNNMKQIGGQHMTAKVEAATTSVEQAIKHMTQSFITQEQAMQQNMQAQEAAAEQMSQEPPVSPSGDANSPG